MSTILDNSLYLQRYKNVHFIMDFYRNLGTLKGILLLKHLLWAQHVNTFEKLVK